MHADPQLERHLRRGAFFAPHLTVPLGIVACLVVVLGVYWRTTLSMVAIWERSETFTHGFVVLPIFLYMVWRERAVLGAISPKPFYPALAAIAGAGFVWMLAELSAAIGVAQLAMMTMVPLAVWAVFGTATVRAFAIPLAFLFFAVPFGEALVPKLMDWTADFVVHALRASGVPVWREANYFVIPSGHWSVVEACSGLRYLIASLMVGCLYAYLSYRSTKRRVLFIAASIAVPIVANWVRAYIIVMLGHLTDNRLAAGVDHIIYGWIFFGVVMALLFAVGARWREDDLPAGRGDADTHAAVLARDSSPVDRRTIALASMAALAIVALWPPILSAYIPESSARAPALVPLESGGGWKRSEATIAQWQPDFLPPAASLSQAFEKDGMRAGLYIALYRNQTLESKAISTRNRLALTGNKQWRQADIGTAQVDADGVAFAADHAILQSSRQRLVAWHWYWVDGHQTSSDIAAKFFQVLSILRGHGDAVAWVVMYTPDDAEGKRAAAALRDFATALTPRVAAMLATAAKE